MAGERVNVPSRDFREGDLPRVCVVTGQPADGLVDVRFNSAPAWTWILLLFGVLPFLIVTWFATERLSGALPVTREALSQHHFRRRWSWVLIIVGLLVIGVGGYSSWPWWQLAGAAVLVAGVGIRVMAELGFVTGQVAKSGESVRLSRVHPYFADALRGRH